MNHSPLTMLASHFPGALWLQIEPKTTRKREDQYFVQWEDRMGPGCLLFSQPQLRYLLTEPVVHSDQPASPLVVPASVPSSSGNPIVSVNAQLRRAETEFHAGRMSVDEFRQIKKVLSPTP